MIADTLAMCLGKKYCENWLPNQLFFISIKIIHI